MKWANNKWNFIVNREYYLAQADITDQGLTHHRPDQHCSLCPTPQSLPPGWNESRSLATTCKHTQAAHCWKGLWTEFGSWSLITPLFAANKGLVSLCSGLGNWLSPAFKAPWHSFSVPFHLSSCPTAFLHTEHLSGTEIWSVWPLCPWCVLHETNENKIKTMNSPPKRKCQWLIKRWKCIAFQWWVKEWQVIT